MIMRDEVIARMKRISNLKKNGQQTISMRAQVLNTVANRWNRRNLKFQQLILEFAHFSHGILVAWHGYVCDSDIDYALISRSIRVSVNKRNSFSLYSSTPENYIWNLAHKKGCIVFIRSFDIIVLPKFNKQTANQFEKCWDGHVLCLRRNWWSKAELHIWGIYK